MKQFGKARLLFIIFIVLLIIFVIYSFILGGTSLFKKSQSSRTQNDYKERMDDSGSLRKTDNLYESDVEWDNSKRKSISNNNQDGTENQEEVDDRMKVYFGFLQLRVNNIKEVRSTISTLADEVGGYVEESYEKTIIIRIPKQLFSEILTKLMDMGDVLNKSIETYDVTDFFQDLTSRLEISKMTRNRLYALLDKTKDVKERLKILKEIRRLSEEIETISMTLENIKRLISFSRITIKLEQRLSDLSYDDKRTIPFPWIASLDPFYVSLTSLSGKVTIHTGDEFAVFKNKRYFFAESTEGVRLHIATTKNSPKGDIEFWQKAVEYHLSRFYKETQLIDLGAFKAIQFMSKDAEPFYYIVCVSIKENTIFVCEVLFPNQTAFTELEDKVKTYISESIIH